MITATQPTPGPWVLHAPGSLRVGDGRHEREEGCRTLVEAEIVGIPRPEAEANARLIAAAPALLEAARAVLQWFEDLKASQHTQLVEGQTFESASRNWETMITPSFDFTPLMQAVAHAEGR